MTFIYCHHSELQQTLKLCTLNAIFYHCAVAATARLHFNLRQQGFNLILNAESCYVNKNKKRKACKKKTFKLMAATAQTLRVRGRRDVEDH